MELSGVPYQVMAGHRLEEGVACPKNQRHEQEKKPTRPQPEKGALKCPRCASTNTKFCYYNNYSLSQPRYFCKGCRRYWTHGGSLRNVPVGGGCRKNRRSTTPSCSKKTAQDQDPLLPPPPPLPFDPSDLTLAFATQPPIKPQFEDSNRNLLLGNNTAVSSMVPAPANGFHDVLRTGFIDISSMYYGGNNGEDTRLMSFEEGMVAGATASSEASQGSYKALDGRDDKMPMGLPWQLDAGSMLDNSARDCSWNGVGSSAWQGLINSSLL